MAVNLTIALTDAEQAVMEEIATYYKPGATAAEKKAWAEKAAKNGLRQRVIELQNRRVQEEAQATRDAENVTLNTGWPTVDESA
jgi:hypothetical protein